MLDLMISLRFDIVDSVDVTVIHHPSQGGFCISCSFFCLLFHLFLFVARFRWFNRLQLPSNTMNGQGFAINGGKPSIYDIHSRLAKGFSSSLLQVVEIPILSYIVLYSFQDYFLKCFYWSSSSCLVLPGHLVFMG